MADLLGPGNSDRDIDKVLVALKRGAQLLKYGRKGKPKFYPFRLSNDESSLIWHSTGGEKVLKFASILKIVPGQRTGVFQRYCGRGKDYLSFSLIYESGKRSLDLICKDKVEAELWFAGLHALINASGQGGRSKIVGWSDEGTHFDDGRDLSYLRLSDSSVSSAPRNSSSPERSLWSNNSAKNSTESLVPYLDRSDATNMQGRLSSSDVPRVSVSSNTSSSHGSGQDDYDSLGDVYLWGQIVSDSSAREDDIYDNPSERRTDVLLPRAMESNTSVLDVRYVACGVRHAALVTRHGEVFTWGEEAGGRLGHGIKTDATIQPRLVESLSSTTCEFVACGEFHTCAVNLAGELYTWGDGSYHYGILGHGNDISQCIPKRVSGPLERLHVAYVSCGIWHTALITSAGQLFTFGDGAFGVLGHGDRESSLYPREVESLKMGLNLKTVTVACGVWHTAAVVEVTALMQSKSSVSSGKLFTWGDGDKYRLGHGDDHPRLEPTCVSYLIDHNFHKLACGHSLTIGSTVSGRIFAMGSADNGQLGNPYSDGKTPCLVEDRLAGEWVGQIACGSYHVAVLTTKNEVYTWGKGENGRLGHGDRKDRNTPTLVEALKYTTVKNITCGTNFTVAICQHKRVSGAEQSQCSSCRLAFGFTRKRHNCYNCGFVFCHSCSSKKALKAAMSGNPNKPYRVCDSCHVKLSKLDSNNNKKVNNLDAKTASKHGKMGEVSSYLLSADFQNMGSKPVGNSRSVSPFFTGKTTGSSRSTTPVPTTPRQSSMEERIVESLKKANEEVQKLQIQVECLRMLCEHQEQDLLKSELKAQKATTFATDESAKSKAAKQVMKLLTAQLKDLAGKLPSAVARQTNAPNGNDYPHAQISQDGFEAKETSLPSEKQRHMIFEGADVQQNQNGDHERMIIPGEGRTDMVNFQTSGTGSETAIPTLAGNQQVVDAEWMEQYEPGVYIALVALKDGTRDLKRVRFSRRRFAENRAKSWWSENHEKVYMKYNIRPSDKASELPL